MQRILPGQNSSEDGQAVLIVLLIMSVILIIGLSIASRSVTDIKISQQSQEAARALWVAQGGLEQAIKENPSVGSPVEGNLGGVTYSVTKTGLGGNSDFVFPGNFGADKPATLWLEGYSGNLTFFWGKEGTRSDQDVTPALEATLIYSSSGSYLSRRYVYDPNSSRRISSTHFDSPSSSCSAFNDGTKFAFCSPIVISLPSGSHFVRLKLFFNDTTDQPIGVRGSASLPSQGDCFESLATVPESGVSRKLKQCQLKGATPSIFDYVLFSGTNI